jgi:hypothetical protein
MAAGVTPEIPGMGGEFDGTVQEAEHAPEATSPPPPPVAAAATTAEQASTTVTTATTTVVPETSHSPSPTSPSTPPVSGTPPPITVIATAMPSPPTSTPARAAVPPIPPHTQRPQSFFATSISTITRAANAMMTAVTPTVSPALVAVQAPTSAPAPAPLVPALVASEKRDESSAPSQSPPGSSGGSKSHSPIIVADKAPTSSSAASLPPPEQPLVLVPSKPCAPGVDTLPQPAPLCQHIPEELLGYQSFLTEAMPVDTATFYAMVWATRSNFWHNVYTNTGYTEITVTPWVPESECSCHTRQWTFVMIFSHKLTGRKPAHVRTT